MNRGDFIVGTVVRLQSGGPPMTVVGKVADDLWTCSYFENGRATNHNFPPESLVPAGKTTERD